MNTHHEEKKAVTTKSLIASALLTAFKVVVGLLTGSMGILSEAIHSSIDFVATIITYFSVKLADRPADKRHHYGHGKIENVTALIETGMLFGMALIIIYEAVKRLMSHDFDIEITWYAFAVIVLSIIIDVNRSAALRKVAKKTGSQAIEADALNFTTDIYSSCVVILGLLLAYFGFPAGDAIASIGVSAFILFAAYRLFMKNVDVLIDSAPEGIETKVIEISKKIEEVINIESIRIRPVGHAIFIDMDIAVSRKHSIGKINEIKAELKKEINKKIKVADISIKASPLTLNEETIADRVKIESEDAGLSAHDISVHVQNGKKYITFDLEVDSETKLADAHKDASKIENSLKQAIGGEVYVMAHIEPIYSERHADTVIPSSEKKDLIERIQKINGGELFDYHNFIIAAHDSKIHINFHCFASKNSKIEDVHHQTSVLNDKIKSLSSKIERVTIHTEPK